MSDQFFIKTAIEIRVNAAPFVLTGATNPKIVYFRSTAVKGEWPAAISGNEVVYTTTDTDIQVAGDWKFQAKVTKGGGTKLGTVATQTFKEQLV